MNGSVNITGTTLDPFVAVHKRLCGVFNTLLVMKLIAFDQKYQNLGGRRVEIGGGGTLKISIFTKRVHFWASLVHPRLP